MKVVFFVLTLITSAQAFAQERYDFYRGIRQMGMGGAGVAVVNDETALLTNPAGLGKLRDYFITVVDPELEVGSETQNIARNDILKMTNPQDALNKTLNHKDENMHMRGQVFPSLVVPNFGVGFYGKYQVDARVDSTKNLFDYDYTNDYALVFGFNFRFFNGILKLGTNARVVNRTEVHDHTIATTSTDLSLRSLAKSGVGVGSDTGMMLTAPVAYLPTLAAVYRDVGRTSYGLRDGLFMNTTNHPDQTASTVDTALSIQPILGKRVRSTWTIEYQDVLTASKETDQMRRVHGGVEFNFADAVFVRAGMNQRYWTAGLELAMMNYQFQAASYGEDIGVAGTPIEDRRYLVKFAFRF